MKLPGGPLLHIMTFYSFYTEMAQGVDRFPTTIIVNICKYKICMQLQISHLR